VGTSVTRQGGGAGFANKKKEEGEQGDLQLRVTLYPLCANERSTEWKSRRRVRLASRARLLCIALLLTQKKKRGKEGGETEKEWWKKKGYESRERGREHSRLNPAMVEQEIDLGESRRRERVDSAERRTRERNRHHVTNDGTVCILRRYVAVAGKSPQKRSSHKIGLSPRSSRLSFLSHSFPTLNILDSSPLSDFFLSMYSITTSAVNTKNACSKEDHVSTRQW